MSTTNFSLPNFENGNIITADDLNSIFGSVHVIFESLLADNTSSPLLPASYAGQNRIAETINNSIFALNSDGDAVLIPRQFFDDSVASALDGAERSQAAYAASLAMGSLLPVQAGNAGLGLTTNGEGSSWGISAAEAISILNFLNY